MLGRMRMFGALLLATTLPACSGHAGERAEEAPSASSGDGSAFVQVAKLVASDATQFASFGHSVAVSGDTAVVGASTQGRAYVYARRGDAWAQEAELDSGA